MDEDEILKRARRAYITSCSRAGSIAMAPRQSSCRVTQVEGTWWVVLANGVGLPDDFLAVYELVGNPMSQYRLVGRSKWPEALGNS